MFDFEQALLEYVAPRLNAAGYGYDNALRDRDILYGFRKSLKGDIQALIVFQRQQYEERPVGHGFTVNLVRCKTKDRTQWHRGHYEGFLNQRLSWVIWYVYELRTYAHSDHWWTPANENQVRDELADAIDKVEQYGIPWLEDLSSRIPGMPDELVAQFRKALLRIVVPDLRELGYQDVECGHRCRFCFGKQVVEDYSAFVAFEVRGSPPRFEDPMFDVLLLRRWSRQPWDSLSQGTSFGSLGLLLWEECGLRKGLYRYYDWEYSTIEDLERQLEDALEKIKDIAIPWLENLSS